MHPSQHVREREILRIAATLGGADGEQAAHAARREILRWAENRTGRLPTAAWTHGEFEHFSGGRNCTAIRIVDETKDIWAIRADDPDKTVAQRIWTTEAVVGRRPGQRALLSLRLLVSSPEQDLEIDPTVPGLVLQIASRCGLYDGARKISSDFWVVESEDDADHLVEILTNQQRKKPVLVLSVPDNATDPNSPLLDPDQIARKTLGIAEVVVLPSKFTWALSDRFGKRLSVFGGAIRIYMPGFTEETHPYGRHELILPEKFFTLEDQQRTSALVQKIAASESIKQLRLGKDVISFSAARELYLDSVRSRLQQEGATDEQKLKAAYEQIDTLKIDLKRSNDDVDSLFDELQNSENKTKSIEDKLSYANFRIEQLQSQLKNAGENPDKNIPIPNSWNELSDWIDQDLGGRVTLSPRARREIKAPLFKDVATVARCLLWLANDYRDRRLSGGNGDLRIYIEEGILNDRCGADTFQADWQGKKIDVEWHIKNGGNTRDPTRCLRIYYFWDDTRQQVIIVSMPAHLDTGAS